MISPEGTQNDNNKIIKINEQEEEEDNEGGEDSDEMSGSGPVLRHDHHRHRHYFDDQEDDDDDDEEDQDDGTVSTGGGDEETEEEKVEEKEDQNDLMVLFNRRQINNRFRKTDAIKTISTPHGKVRILYETNNNGGDGQLQKDVNSKDSAAANEVKPKISPVLINGTVALLYRGDQVSNSENNIRNNKYMPITSITNFNNNFNRDNTVNAVGGNEEGAKEAVPPVPVTEATIAQKQDTTIIILHGAQAEIVNGEDGEGTLFKKDDNSVLPSIDRPLSEVLGIKKNQFTLFRIADTTTTTKRTFVTIPPGGRSSSSSSSVLTKEGNEISNYDYEDGLIDDADDDYNVDSNKVARTRTTTEVSIKTELVNLAIIPSFDSDLEKSTKYQNARNRGQPDLTAVHCAMQAMVAIAAMATVFGILGAYFKTRILDQIMIMHW